MLFCYYLLYGRKQYISNLELVFINNGLKTSTFCFHTISICEMKEYMRLMRKLKEDKNVISNFILLRSANKVQRFLIQK